LKCLFNVKDFVICDTLWNFFVLYVHCAAYINASMLVYYYTDKIK